MSSAIGGTPYPAGVDASSRVTPCERVGRVMGVIGRGVGHVATAVFSGVNFARRKPLETLTILMALSPRGVAAAPVQRTASPPVSSGAEVAEYLMLKPWVGHFDPFRVEFDACLKAAGAESKVTVLPLPMPPPWPDPLTEADAILLDESNVPPGYRDYPFVRNLAAAGDGCILMNSLEKLPPERQRATKAIGGYLASMGHDIRRMDVSTNFANIAYAGDFVIIALAEPTGADPCEADYHPRVGCEKELRLLQEQFAGDMPVCMFQIMAVPGLHPNPCFDMDLFRAQTFNEKGESVEIIYSGCVDPTPREGMSRREVLAFLGRRSHVVEIDAQDVRDLAANGVTPKPGQYIVPGRVSASLKANLATVGVHVIEPAITLLGSPYPDHYGIHCLTIEVPRPRVAGLVTRKAAPGETVGYFMIGPQARGKFITQYVKENLQRTGFDGDIIEIRVDQGYNFPRNLGAVGPGGVMLLNKPGSLLTERTNEALKGLAQAVEAAGLQSRTVGVRTNFANFRFEPRHGLLVVAIEQPKPGYDCKSGMQPSKGCKAEIDEVIAAFGSPQHLLMCEIARAPRKGDAEHPKCFDSDLFLRFVTGKEGQKVVLVYEDCISKTGSKPALPRAAFLKRLAGFAEVISIDEEDFDKLVPNSISPVDGTLLVPLGISKGLKQELAARGVEVIEPDAELGSAKWRWGISCLTLERPAQAESAAVQAPQLKDEV